jgi:hypothetical protein
MHGLKCDFANARTLVDPPSIKSLTSSPEFRTGESFFRPWHDYTSFHVSSLLGQPLIIKGCAQQPYIGRNVTASTQTEFGVLATSPQTLGQAGFTRAAPARGKGQCRALTEYLFDLP